MTYEFDADEDPADRCEDLVYMRSKELGLPRPKKSRSIGMGNRYTYPPDSNGDSPSFIVYDSDKLSGDAREMAEMRIGQIAAKHEW